MDVRVDARMTLNEAALSTNEYDLFGRDGGLR